MHNDYVFAGGWSAFGGLTPALRSILACRGMKVDWDDLNAALGLSMLICAAPEEACLARWSFYARDAFLLDGGALLGLRMRAIHPPEAARGLRRLAEFEQHFEASYRPLVLRALEHGQPVLAWQGWPGCSALMWGIIENACEDGIGLCGRVFASPDSEVPLSPTALQKPPLQLYVVEEITHIKPDGTALLATALMHAKESLGNAVGRRFGVVTGPAACDLWTQRLNAVPTGDTCGDDVLLDHHRLLSAVSHAHRLAAGFFDRRRAVASDRQRPLIDTLREVANEVAALGEPETAGEETSQADPDRRANDDYHAINMALEQVAFLRAAACKAQTALQAGFVHVGSA